MNKLICLFLALSVGGYAQNEATQSTKDRLNYGDIILRNNSSNLLYGFDSRTSEVVGDYYWFTEWAVATVDFYPRMVDTPTGAVRLDTLYNVLIRYNIQTNDLEFDTPNGVKIVSGAMVKSLQFKRKEDVKALYLINTIEYVDNNNAIKPSFFEVLVKGKRQLLEYTEIKIKKPDYVASLNVGSTDTRIVKDKFLYITEGKEAIRFVGKRKETLELLADKRSEVLKFVRSEGLLFRKRADLIRIFEYYDSL
jgi:hypothetical protein